jgi:hypothetical protein
MEWASWWDKTIMRWHNEGLPIELQDAGDIRDYFGLDTHRHYWIPSCGHNCPQPSGHGGSIISDRADYIRVKPYLYPENAFDKEMVRGWAQQQSGFIPSVDHQTPPEVSLEDYRTYVRVLKEYSVKACE